MDPSESRIKMLDHIKKINEDYRIAEEEEREMLEANEQRQKNKKILKKEGTQRKLRLQKNISTRPGIPLKKDGEQNNDIR